MARWKSRSAAGPFHIKREFLDDIAEHGLMAHVARLHKALLVMHSPTDDTVGIDNATHIFVGAKHPKSFVSLAGADHLLTKKADAAYVADVIAAWSERYLDSVMSEKAVETGEAPRPVVVRETRDSRFPADDRQSGHITCWPTSRLPPAARTPDPGPMISCWRASAPAPR